MATNITVAILAGGRSSRMGRDKALLPWRGRPMIDQVIATAGEVRDSVETIVIGDRVGYHGRGARVVADLYPSAGPLGGIATALVAAETARVLVLAVDMPFVSVPLINAMVSHQTGADILLPEIREVGARGEQIERLHVLHAIYGERCLEPARDLLCKNVRRVAALCECVAVERLKERWLRRYDPDLRSFQNVNEPGDYVRAVDQDQRDEQE